MNNNELIEDPILQDLKISIVPSSKAQSSPSKKHRDFSLSK